MSKTFNEVLEQMLEAYEENPEKGADAVVSETLKDLGVSEESQQKAEKAGCLNTVYLNCERIG